MRTRAWACAAVGAVLAVSLMSGCTGSKPAETEEGLEKADIKVAVLSIVDDSPLFLAQKYGYFRQEGLTVTPVTVANGAEGLLRMQSGAVDLTWSSYPNLLSGIDSGTLKARIVADGYATAKNLFLVATMPGSGIAKPADLVGKKVSVNAPKGLGPLLLAATLKGYGVDLKSLKLVPMEFPAMPAALQNRSIDAAWITEPFATQVLQRVGATPVLDTGTGPTGGLSIAGWVTSEQNAGRYPKTLAAFRRAMAKAQARAHDRGEVAQILPTYIRGLDPQVASSIAIGTFPDSTDAVQLQRVSDLMQQNGMLSKHIDMKPIVLPQSQ
jgi:NitT/TauT family transport system substrate-binding protein